MADNNANHFENAKRNVNEAFDQGKEALKEGYQATREMGNNSYDYMINCIKNNPITSMLMAAMIGAIAAWCCRVKKD